MTSYLYILKYLLLQWKMDKPRSNKLKKYNFINSILHENFLFMIRFLS